jgi:hypothetical protein
MDVSESDLRKSGFNLSDVMIVVICDFKDGMRGHPSQRTTSLDFASAT